MAEKTPSNARRKLGVVLVVLGVAVWLVGAVLYLGNVTGLLPSIPYAGSVTAGLGGTLEALGFAFMRGAPVGGLERRRTSLVVVIPALVLFCPMLLGAALLFGQNFEHGASAGWWIGSTVFLLVSIAIVSALVRDIVLRFDKSARSASGRGPPVASESGPGERW